MRNQILILSSISLTAFLPISCTTQTPEDRLNKLGPLNGPSDVNFIVSSSGSELDLSNTANLAQTLGQYRRLNLSEAEKVRRLAQTKFDGFVVREIQNLRPKYEARRRKIKTESASPAEVATKLAKLDDDLRKEAVIAVKRRYGSQIAVPLRTRDNKPAVAITQISGDKVKAPASAIELNKTPGSNINHRGKTTPVTSSSIPLNYE